MNIVLQKMTLASRSFFAVCLMVSIGAAGLCAQEEAVTPAREAGRFQVHHSSEFGWSADQDVTEQFAALLESGKLKPNEELVLDHKYRIRGSHSLPDSFTLSAVKGAGFDVTDVAGTWRWQHPAQPDDHLP